MPSNATCPFCKEQIDVAAIKCNHCLEFLPSSSGQLKRDDTTKLLPEFFALIGKTFVPIAVVILALTFKPTIEGLLTRTKQAEFLGTKLVFEETRGYKGALTPIELYYLIGSASRYGTDFAGAWNLDMLESNGQVSVIYGLRDKGLIEVKIREHSSDVAAKGYGKKGISTRPTEKGKDFLIELGLKFDGKSFVLAP